MKVNFNTSPAINGINDELRLGGKPDFSKGPFVAYCESVVITDYAGGEHAGTEAKRYVYTDTSGTWKSIRVDGDSLVSIII